MLEDTMFLWKLKRGDASAIHSVYEKYKQDMLSLAAALARDRTACEDIVHDVFVSFVRISPKLRLRSNLRAYLLSSVANRVRNIARAKPVALPAENSVVYSLPPDSAVIDREQEELISHAMAQLPYDQREIIILHFQAGMKFREIASSMSLSINTVQSRYRYGLQKLRILLEGKVAL